MSFVDFRKVSLAEQIRKFKYVILYFLARRLIGPGKLGVIVHGQFNLTVKLISL
jgi:hypothetical protein